MILKTRKTKRGGARPGAGRKPAGTMRMEVWVKPETAARLRAVENKTPGQVIDDLI